MGNCGGIWSVASEKGDGSAEIREKGHLNCKDKVFISASGCFLPCGNWEMETH